MVVGVATILMIERVSLLDRFDSCDRIKKLLKLFKNLSSLKDSTLNYSKLVVIVTCNYHTNMYIVPTNPSKCHF